MSDDPSNWELARRLDMVYQAQQLLIGRAEYTEYQRNIDHRISDLRQDIEDVRKAHDDYVTSTTAHKQWKSLLYTGLIPSLVSVAAILVTIALRGK